MNFFKKITQFFSNLLPKKAELDSEEKDKGGVDPGDAITNPLSDQPVVSTNAIVVDKMENDDDELI